MSIIAKDIYEDFESIPLGLQQAVCVFVEDLGTHRQIYANKEILSPKVTFCFESINIMEHGENKGKPFMISNIYTTSLSKKANLSKDLESWLGKTISPEARKQGIDLKKFIGMNCMINVIERESDKKHIINNILPKTDGLEDIKPFNNIPPDWINKFRKNSVEIDCGTQDGSPF